MLEVTDFFTVDTSGAADQIQPSMDRIESAYRILGISERASPEEVREAFEELKSVWDPSRFHDDPEMAEKAHSRLLRIEEAYTLLRVQSRRSLSPPPHPWLEEREKKQKSRNRGKSKSRKRIQQDEASLFHDAFSEGLAEPKKRALLWIIASAILLIPIALLFFSPDTTSDGFQTEDQQAVESSEQEAHSTERDPSPPEAGGVERSDEPATAVLRKQAPADSEITPETASRGEDRKALPPVDPTRRPTLVRGDAPGVDSSPAEQEQLRGSMDDEGITGSRAEQAFLVLKLESQAARELLSNQIPELQFVSWKALPKDADELWIDLTAEAIPSGEVIHFIWAINPKDRRARPMSQAARNLELGRSRM